MATPKAKETFRHRPRRRGAQVLDAAPSNGVEQARVIVCSSEAEGEGHSAVSHVPAGTGVDVKPNNTAAQNSQRVGSDEPAAAPASASAAPAPASVSAAPTFAVDGAHGGRLARADETSGIHEKRLGDAGTAQRSSRKERLTSASVLDAPASLHESEAPPPKASWAMRSWVALMLAIIGAAGVVAYRDHQARQGGLHSEPLSEQAPQGDEPQAAEAAALPVPTGLVDPSSADSPAPVQEAKAAPAQRASSATAGAGNPAGKTAPAAAGKAAATAEAPRPTAAARKPGEAADVGTAQQLASTAAAEAARITMGVAAPSAAKPILDEPVADPRPNAQSIVSLPGNPYEAEE